MGGGKSPSTTGSCTAFSDERRSVHGQTGKTQRRAQPENQIGSPHNGGSAMDMVKRRAKGPIWMDGWMDGWIDGWMDGWMGQARVLFTVKNVSKDPYRGGDLL